MVAWAVGWRLPASSDSWVFRVCRRQVPGPPPPRILLPTANAFNYITHPRPVSQCAWTPSQDGGTVCAPGVSCRARAAGGVPLAQ